MRHVSSSTPVTDASFHALATNPRVDQPVRDPTARSLCDDPHGSDDEQDAHRPDQPLHQRTCMGHEGQRNVDDDAREGGDDGAYAGHLRSDHPFGA